MLPNTALLSDLERSHPDRQYYQKTYVTIRDLREGATTLLKNVERYLPKRAGEEPYVYQARCQKFCYTPVMNTAIREFAAKLASAAITVDGATGDMWDSFRTSIDGNGQNEDEFIVNLFTTLLYFGSVYLAIDMPVMDEEPRSLAEDPGNLPFIRIFSPLDVRNYGDGWYCVRTFYQTTNPLEKHSTICRWTFFTDTETVAYEAPVQLNYTDMGESVTKAVLNGSALSIRSKSAVVPAVKRYKHGLGKCPLVALELPPELWTAHHVYLKQLQYIRIESSYAESGENSGVVQRVYTPVPVVPTDDPSKLYIEPDYDQVKFDNSHVLVGAKYEFVESEGKAIANLSAQLAEIRAEINAIVSMGYKAAPASKQAQSGLSKDMDMTLLEDAMRTYGQKVAQTYERALRIVAAMMGAPTDISVNGLDHYTNDALADMIDQLVKLQPAFYNLPPTALKLWTAKLCKLMTGATGKADAEAIREELEDIFTNGLDPNNPDHVNKVAADLGLDPEQASALLSGGLVDNKKAP